MDLNARRLFSPETAHSFHIPVMGTGFTIDTPLRVARFGISSVISLVDDVLIEQMREYHARECGHPYEFISSRDPDPRAHRITAYLNLLNRLIQNQMEAMRASDFERGGDLDRYFKLLPDGPVRRLYGSMRETMNLDVRRELQEQLKDLIRPGSIDVNIMTKLNRDPSQGTKADQADAISALRGYALSEVTSSIIFSAGLNRGLFEYMASFDDFFPDQSGFIKKKIVLKVSDVRSAEIQGQFLAKKGLWVSEFRVESGLNCGGHAFPTKGLLMGPILEQFSERRDEIRGNLFKAIQPVWSKRNLEFGAPPPIRVTAQGGIGTAEEDQLLRREFGVDATGWGTPFLLVPEATQVDRPTLQQLAAARNGEVYLSDSSPLGVPFWNLRDSSSEKERLRRVEEGEPGTPCKKGFLASNTEFTKHPICLASRTYQRLKLQALREEGGSEQRQQAMKELVLSRSCICHELGGGARQNVGIAEDPASAVCPGPGIRYFSKISSLEEMVDHIYGRGSLLTGPSRPHMFLGELELYIDYLREQTVKMMAGVSNCSESHFKATVDGLQVGIDWYRTFAEKFDQEKRSEFLEGLAELQERLAAIHLPELLALDAT